MEWILDPESAHFLIYSYGLYIPVGFPALIPYMIRRIALLCERPFWRASPILPPAVGQTDFAAGHYFPFKNYG